MRAAQSPANAMYYCSVLLPLFSFSGVIGFSLQPHQRMSYRIRNTATEKEFDNDIFRVYSSRDNDTRTWTQQRSHTGSSPPSTTSNALSSQLAPINRRHNRSDSFSNSKSSSLPQRRQKMKPMPVTGYDARAIEDYYDMRPLEVVWRLNSLGFPLLGKGYV
jgi:hypothetical protein